jgi:hypothetical protein
MALNISEQKILPIRRDGQTPTTTVIGSYSIGCSGTYSGGTGVSYSAGPGICITGTSIRADFGTTSTEIACGSHTHSNYACCYHKTSHITGADILPTFTCTCRGLVPPPNSCDGLSVLTNDGSWKQVNSLSGITDTMFLQFQGYGSGTLTNATNYYFGNNNTLTTTANQHRVYVPTDGTISKIYVNGYAGTAGNACYFTLHLIKNNTTCCCISTVCCATSTRLWCNGNVCLPVVAGDYLQIKACSCSGAGAIYFAGTALVTSQITPFLNTNVTELCFYSDGTPYGSSSVCVTSNVCWTANEAACWFGIGGCTNACGNGCFYITTMCENLCEYGCYNAVCITSPSTYTRYIGIYQDGFCCGGCELC